MTTKAPSPIDPAGMPLGWNVQANGNEALTGNKPDPSFSGALTASGLLAESYDFNLVSSGVLLSVAGAGVPVVSAIPLLTEQTVATLWYDVTVQGATLTAARCWAFLLNSAGTVLGISADQATAWSGANPGLGGNGNAGTALVAVTTGSLSNLPAGTYYGALVYTGTTAPTIASLNADQYITNIYTTVAAANFNAASLTPSITTSGSITSASPFVLTSSTLVSKRLWMGLS